MTLNSHTSGGRMQNGNVHREGAHITNLREKVHSTHTIVHLLLLVTQNQSMRILQSCTIDPSSCFHTQPLERLKINQKNFATLLIFKNFTSLGRRYK